MQVEQRTRNDITHSTGSATLADVLDRILDKGLVIAGDIKIKLVDIELLTIQIRLLICSVDRAKEMGIDWWTTSPYLSSGAEKSTSIASAPILKKRAVKKPNPEVAVTKQAPVKKKAAVKKAASR